MPFHEGYERNLGLHRLLLYKEGACDMGYVI